MPISSVYFFMSPSRRSYMSLWYWFTDPALYIEAISSGLLLMCVLDFIGCLVLRRFSLFARIVLSLVSNEPTNLFFDIIF